MGFRCRLLVSPAEVPDRIVDLKRDHFREVFGDDWETVYGASPLIDTREYIVLMEAGRSAVAWAAVRFGAYAVRFRGFMVDPALAGRGHATELFSRLESFARSYHDSIFGTRDKPGDIGIQYQSSLAYIDAPDDGRPAPSALQFGRFLRRRGFRPVLFAADALSTEEHAAIGSYRRRYPEHAGSIRRFARSVVDTGVRLDADVRRELDRLDGRQRSVVLRGLRAKLGHFRESGRISYRFDMCPICRDMGCSLGDDRRCPDCYIYRTCRTPFREPGRFKEDTIVSAAYFTAVEKYLSAF